MELSRGAHQQLWCLSHDGWWGPRRLERVRRAAETKAREMGDRKVRGEHVLWAAGDIALEIGVRAAEKRDERRSPDDATD